MLRRHGHGHAAAEDRDHQDDHGEVGRKPKTGAPACGSPPPAPSEGRASGGGRRKIAGQRQHRDADEQPEHQHGLAPAELGDAGLEQVRPQGARQRLARGDHGHGCAPAAIEPAADIGHDRREYAGGAEQTHQQAVSHIEVRESAGGGEDEAGGDHCRTEQHDAADAEPARQPSRRDAAEGRTDQGQAPRRRRARRARCRTRRQSA